MIEDFRFMISDHWRPIGDKPILITGNTGSRLTAPSPLRGEGWGEGALGASSSQSPVKPPVIGERSLNVCSKA